MPFTCLLFLLVGVLVPELEASSSRIWKEDYWLVQIFVHSTESWLDWSFFLGWTVFLRRMGFFVLNGNSSVLTLFVSANFPSSFLFLGDFPLGTYLIVITTENANITYFSSLGFWQSSFIFRGAKRRHWSILKLLFVIHKILENWNSSKLSEWK